MKRRQELKRIAASAMAAVMMVTAMPMGVIVYGEEIPTEKITNVDDTEISVASGSNSEHQKSSNSNADMNLDQKDDAGQGSEIKDHETIGTVKNENVKKKIASWSWNDSEGILIDGELQLSVMEEDQISFTDVVSMLPESITAKILDEDESETEEEIAVTEWTCEDYIQSEADLWPTTGEFVFAAEIADEYCLMEDVDALDVRVVLADPGVEMLAASVSMSDKITIIGMPANQQLAQGQSFNGTNYKVTNTGNNTYKLELNNANLSGQLTLCIKDGNWIVEVNGNNRIIGTNGLSISNKANVTLEGNGTLQLTGKTGYGIDMIHTSTLTIDSSTMKVIATSNSNNGIEVAGSSNLYLKSGEIEATGSYGINIRSGQNDVNGTSGRGKGTVTISGGKLTVHGSDGGVDNTGKLYITGGELNVSTDSNHGIKVWESASMEITGNGKVTSSSETMDGVFIMESSCVKVSGSGASLNGTIGISGSASSLTIEQGGTLETTCLENNGIFNISNSGKLVLNGNYSGSGAFNNDGGNITGEGTLPDDKKIARTFTYPKGESVTEVFQNQIAISQYFAITPSEETITYEIDNSGIDDNEKGEGSIESGCLAVEKAGKFRIKASVEKNGLYTAATGNIILNVTKASLAGISVEPYRGTYDGSEHPAVTVKLNGATLPDDFKVSYAAAGTEESGQEYSADMPMVKDVSDTGKEYSVRIESDNYETFSITSGKIAISKRSMTEVVPMLVSSREIYDGNEKNPEVRAGIRINGTMIYELENTDYSVEWKTVDSNAKLSDSGNPVNAGTYRVVLKAASDNFTGENAEDSNPELTIEKKELTAKIEGDLKKTYDGTKRVDSAQKLKIALYDGSSRLADSSVYVNNNVIFEYTDVNAGTGKTIKATNIGLTGDGAANYSVNNTAETDKGEIVPSDRVTYIIMQADTLTYNGTEQAAAIKVSARNPVTGNELELPQNGISVKYSKEKDGEYTDAVPTFKNAGNYVVYYKVSAINYKEVTGSQGIVIHPLDINNNNTTWNLYNREQTYAGTPLQTSSVVKAGDNEIPKEDYRVDYAQNDGTYLDSVTEAGSYKIRLIGTGENCIGEKRFTLPFIVKPKSIKRNTIEISVSSQNGLIYNGASQNLDISVYDREREGTKLIEDKDYTVTYTPQTNAGEYTKAVVIEGIGNYTDQQTCSYSIGKRSLKDADIRVDSEYIYDGKAQEPSKDKVHVSIGNLTVPSDAYTISYSNNINAGSDAHLEIRAAVTEEGQNYTDSKTADFTIKPAELKISNVVLKNKVYDGTETVEMESVAFDGLAENDTIGLDDCTNVSAKFTDVNAGTGKQAEVSLELKTGESTKNYELPDGTFLLTGQTIEKAKTPTLENIKVSYSFGATGTKTVDITGLPDDIGTYFGAAAEVSSDAIRALGNSVTVNGTKVTFELLGNKKENIGKTSEILVKNIETQNYENAVLKILVTMDPKKDQGVVSGKMTFTPNSDDETFTAEITAVDGAEYSFDGETWSDVNQRADCFADTSYTGYIRMKETEEFYAGLETAVTAVSPKAYAKTPVITPDGGSFWSKQEVVVESATKDAKIYYTLDGTDPTTESSLYTGPFEISEKATVKAIVVKEHLENSAVATAEFTRNYSSSDSDDYEPETGKGSGASGSGNTAGAAGRIDNGTITKDAIKGVISSVNGIITGATNSTAHDGYSHWMKDENGWWLRYNDGSYPKGTKSSGSTSDTSYGWEQINGAWWAFDENGYMRSGWVLDAAFGGWFYVDEDHGMQTGWFFINGKWYYLNPVSDGRRGIMYAGMKTPDGWYVGEDGSWDGLAK